MTSRRTRPAGLMQGRTPSVIEDVPLHPLRLLTEHLFYMCVWSCVYVSVCVRACFRRLIY